MEWITEIIEKIKKIIIERKKKRTMQGVMKIVMKITKRTAKKVSKKRIQLQQTSEADWERAISRAYPLLPTYLDT